MGRAFWPIFALWLTLAIQPATAQTFPIGENEYVNDYADLLSPWQEDALREKLADLRKNRDIEMQVVTIRQRADYDQDVSNEAFATALFNRWGIGDRNRNDGVLFLVSRLDRDMRIEVGRGYGRTKDDALKRIIDKVIIPEFRLDNYAAGITKGVDYTIREIAGVWPDQYNASPVTRWWTDIKVWLGAFILVPLAPLGWLVWRAYRAAQRRRPRKCPNDGSSMPRVLEEFEDKHLNAGQQKEEQLASVEYDVWICRKCSHVTIEGYKRWFSGQKLCNMCGFHTLESYSSETTRAPTRHSSGERRTDFRCNNCNKTHTVYTTLAALSDSSSGGGSSGGGGGSSGGGGASGSW